MILGFFLGQQFQDLPALRFIVRFARSLRRRCKFSRWTKCSMEASSSGEHGLERNAAPYPDTCQLICPSPNNAMTAQGKPAVGCGVGISLARSSPRSGDLYAAASRETLDRAPLSAHARERGQPVPDPRLRGDERAMLNLAAAAAKECFPISRRCPLTIGAVWLRHSATKTANERR